MQTSSKCNSDSGLRLQLGHLSGVMQFEWMQSLSEWVLVCYHPAQLLQKIVCGCKDPEMASCQEEVIEYFITIIVITSIRLKLSVLRNARLGKGLHEQVRE